MATKLKRFNMILFGPPGVGKSVYCRVLEKDFGLKAFSTGDSMRDMFKKRVHKFFTKDQIADIEKKVSAGELLSDDIVNHIVDP